MITDIETLESRLSEPTDYVTRSLERAPGDTVILGVGGKMGPTLARMLVRACQAVGDKRTITAVSRFTNLEARHLLEKLGITTIAGDLLEEGTLEGLPDAANVISMTGQKFGTANNAPSTWAMNTDLPARICRRYRGSRIMAFSTGNVYPLVDAAGAWSSENDPLLPVGEYGMSALGRERLFQYFAERDQTPIALARLNYAVELRYGVLVDIAKKVFERQPIDRSTGYANVIWQGDANAMALALLAEASSPATVMNIAGPELVNVEEVASRFATIFNVPVEFTGQCQATALLNDGSTCHRRYGMPRVDLSQMIDWIAAWIQAGNRLLDKPTHFEVRSGQF